MLSESALMRPFVSEVEARRSWRLHLLAEGTELAPDFLDYIRQDRWHVEDLMTTPVVSVSEQTSAREIGDFMTKQRINRVPVLRDGGLVPIRLCGDARKPCRQHAPRNDQLKVAEADEFIESSRLSCGSAPAKHRKTRW
jgi:CBS domain-containing protein